MNDIRWFAPNRFCTLPVSRLRVAGLRIATEGDEPSRLAFAADGVSVAEAYRYSRRHRIPLAVYLWDLPPWQVGRGHPNPIVSIGGRLVKVPMVWRTYPERNGYYSRLRYAARRSVAVWSPSAASTAAVRERFGVAAAEVPFCFDSDRFNRRAGWQPPSGAPIVLAISRLVGYKNHAAVIRAAALLERKVQLRIVGAGPEAAALHALAAELGVALTLDQRWHSDQEMVDAYLGASVVVSLSRFEGLGLTPLEGNAMGIPAIASDIAPHREFAGTATTLVPIDNDHAAARAIDAALLRHAKTPEANHDDSEMTIDACAGRLLPRFAALLDAGRE